MPEQDVQAALDEMDESIDFAAFVGLVKSSDGQGDAARITAADTDSLGTGTPASS